MESVLCGQAEFPISDFGKLFEENALAEYATCQKKERRLYGRLTKAKTPLELAIRTKQYLSSHSCKFVAMVDQAMSRPWPLRQPISAYRTLAKALSLFSPILEAVEFWDKPKGGNKGSRRLFDFGPMNRAAQLMVKRVLSAKWNRKPFQFGVQRFGQAAAISFVRSMIGDGYVHVSKLDCKNFFGSFSREGVAKILPLPLAVVANVAMPDNLHLKPKKGGKKGPADLLCLTGCASTPLTHPTPGQSALPQGALCSNIIADYVISQLDISMPTGVALVMFVDDILIMAKKASDLEPAKNALLLAFAESAAGNFDFEVSEETLQDANLSFLGYLLWIIPGGKLSISPSFQNRLKFTDQIRKRERRLACIHKKKASAEPLIEAIADYYIYRLSWTMAFSASNFHSEMVGAALQRLALLCSKYAVNLTDLHRLAGVVAQHSVIKTPKVVGGYSQAITIVDFGKLIGESTATASDIQQ